MFDGFNLIIVKLFLSANFCVLSPPVRRLERAVANFRSSFQAQREIRAESVSTKLISGLWLPSLEFGYQ